MTDLRERLVAAVAPVRPLPAVGPQMSLQSARAGIAAIIVTLHKARLLNIIIFTSLRFATDVADVLGGVGAGVWTARVVEVVMVVMMMEQMRFVTG